MMKYLLIVYKKVLEDELSLLGGSFDWKKRSFCSGWVFFNKYSFYVWELVLW